MATYVMDTLTLVWLKTNKKDKFPQKVIDIVERVEKGDDFLCIPAIIVWELFVLYSEGLFSIGDKYFKFRDWVQDEILNNPNIIFLDGGNLDDIFIASELELGKTDLIASLTAAAAIRMGMPLITKNPEITGTNICKVIWD